MTVRLVPRGRAAAFKCLIGTLCVTLSGCATYQRKPITREGLDKALAPPPAADLNVRAASIRHPLLPAVQFDPSKGLTPDEAAIMAVLLNPTLKAGRNQRQAAAAQSLLAGILPNPTLSYNYDFITGGDAVGNVNAYGLGLNWEVTSLISHGAKVNAARANAESVDLSVAWQEWQTAEAAKTAVYDLVGAQNQLELAREIDRSLAENAKVLQQAVDRHQKSIVDFAAADATARDAHATVLALEQQVRHQRLVLMRSLGLPPDNPLTLRAGVQLPTSLDLPPEKDLYAGLDSRRLDLIALRKGYDSQEETLRAAVLSQFPKITLGLNNASDNTNVHTTGPGVSIDLPIFDRNQGNIAVETATRQRLFDEFTARTFEARSDLAMALEDIRSLTAQIANLQAVLPSLQRLVDTYKLAYNRGNADVISYYTAVTNLQQQSLNLIKLQQQLADTKTALELAAGWYLPEAGATATRPAPSVPETPPASKKEGPR